MKVRNKYTGEVLEAFQYDGDMQNSDGEYYVPEWAVEALQEGKLFYANIDVGGMPPLCVKSELDYCILVLVDDYVLKFADGRIRPFAAKAFEEIYEIVKDEKTTDSLDQDEEKIYYYDFSPAPVHVLDAQFANSAEIKGDFLAITKKFAAFKFETADSIILQEVAKVATEMGIDCAIVIDESRLKKVLELGVQAFYAKEGEGNE